MTDIDSTENPELEDSELPAGELEDSGLPIGELEESERPPSKGMLRQFAMQIQKISGPPWLAISDKITSDHITTILEHSGKSLCIPSKWAA